MIVVVALTLTLDSLADDGVASAINPFTTFSDDIPAIGEFASIEDLHKTKSMKELLFLRNKSHTDYCVMLITD